MVLLDVNDPSKLDRPGRGYAQAGKTDRPDARASMSNVRFLHIRQRDADLLADVPEDRRRAEAIAFLRSDESVGDLLQHCSAPGADGRASRARLACVLLMVRNDAPQDLVMIDPVLYRRLRERITDLRVGGWIAPYHPGIDG